MTKSAGLCIDAWKQIVMETMKEGKGGRPGKYEAKNYMVIGLRGMLRQEPNRRNFTVKTKERLMSLILFKERERRVVQNRDALFMVLVYFEEQLRLW